MNDLDIVRLRVYVVAPDVTPPYRFTGSCEPFTLYYNIVRLTTRGGVECAAGVLSGDANSLTTLRPSGLDQAHGRGSR